MKGNTLFQKEDLLRHAHLLISGERFTREDSARATAFMDLATRLGDGNAPSPNAEETRALDREFRALSLGTPTQSTANSPLVHQAFYRKLAMALRLFDQLFNENVVTIIETDGGQPRVYPNLDDTANAASITDESDPDRVEVDPFTSAVLSTPPTFRTGVVLVSYDLAQDSAFSISDLLAVAFAIRLSRGAGPTLVASLLAAAVTGATARGSSESTGGSESGTNSIGWSDLCSVVRSIDPAYRATEKVNWLMNSDTLLTLDSIITKQGIPLIHPVYDPDGRRLLLGYPVAICPSMPDIGPGASPVGFGSTQYFVVQVVRNQTRIQILNERFAEFGQVGYRAQSRVNGILLGVTNDSSPASPQSPVKVLVNASD